MRILQALFSRLTTSFSIIMSSTDIELCQLKCHFRIYLSRVMAELWIQLKILCQNPTAYNEKEHALQKRQKKGLNRNHCMYRISSIPITSVLVYFPTPTLLTWSSQMSRNNIMCGCALHFLITYHSLFKILCSHSVCVWVVKTCTTFDSYCNRAVSVDYTETISG